MDNMFARERIRFAREVDKAGRSRHLMRDLARDFAREVDKAGRSRHLMRGLARDLMQEMAGPSRRSLAPRLEQDIKRFSIPNEDVDFVLRVSRPIPIPEETKIVIRVSRPIRILDEDVDFER